MWLKGAPTDEEEIVRDPATLGQRPTKRNSEKTPDAMKSPDMTSPECDTDDEIGRMTVFSEVNTRDIHERQ